jgi:hypothetical protein
MIGEYVVLLMTSYGAPVVAQAPEAQARMAVLMPEMMLV